MKKQKINKIIFLKILFFLLLFGLTGFVAKDYIVPYGKILALHTISPDKALILCEMNTSLSGVFELSLVDKNKRVYWRTLLHEKPANYEGIDGIEFNESLVFVRLKTGIVSYSLETGEEQWRVEKKIIRDTPKNFSLLVQDNQLYSYYTPRNGEQDVLFCMVAATGKILWEKDLAVNSFIAGAAVKENYLVYSYLLTNNIFVINCFTGETVKTINGEDRKPVENTNLVFYLTDTDDSPILNIYNIINSSSMEFPFDKIREKNLSLIGAGEFEDSFILFFNDEIICLSDSGQLLWKLPLNNKIYTDPHAIRYTYPAHDTISSKFEEYITFALYSENTQYNAKILILDCKNKTLIDPELPISKILNRLFQNKAYTIFIEETDYKQEQWLHVITNKTSERKQIKLAATQSDILPIHISDNYLWLFTKDNSFFPYTQFQTINIKSLEYESLHR